MPFQDREGWTSNSPTALRNPSTNTGGSNSSPETSSSPPPPVPPARRGQSQNSNNPYGQFPPTNLVLPQAIEENCDNQSHSAPSSPTHGPEPPPRIIPRPEGSRNSPRPRSIAFPPSSNSETAIPPFTVEDAKYADIRFHDNSPRPVPKPRKFVVNYSDVLLPGNAQGNSHPSSREPTTEPVPDNVNTSTTPPPPVPARNNDTVTRIPPTSNIATPLDLPQLPPSNPFAPLPPLPNPFDIEPSAPDIDPTLHFHMSEFPSFDDDIPLWEDLSLTAMVYDNPPLPPKPTSTQNVPIGIYNTDPQSSLERSDDITGGSAYEDATDIIRAAIERSKLGLPHEPSSVVSKERRSPEFDLPLENEKKNEEGCPTLKDGEVGTCFSPGDSPYDFPMALQNHPKSSHKRQPSDTPTKEDNKERTPIHVDEPPMELMTFASRRPREHSPSLEQKNVPASQLMLSSEQPPLPERNPVYRSISLEPRSRNDTSPPFTTNRGQEPPLPPRNPPRVMNGQPQEPPLPPRNPTSRMSSSPGPPAPVASSQAGSRYNREQTVLELVQLGYSRSDVVKALAISQNNLDLARQILEGFSSRD